MTTDFSDVVNYIKTENVPRALRAVERHKHPALRRSVTAA